MNATTITDTHLVPVFVTLPTMHEYGFIEDEKYVNTGFLSASEERILRKSPRPHKFARFFEERGLLLSGTFFVSGLISIGWAMSDVENPVIRVWVSALLLAALAMLATRVACSRVVARDGRDFSGRIMTSMPTPEMIPFKGLPTEAAKTSKLLEKHRTAAARITSTPAMTGAYTTALTAVAILAQLSTKANNPDGAAALAATHLHHIPEVKALADEYAADTAAAQDAQRTAGAAIQAFADGVKDARVMAAAAAR